MSRANPALKYKTWVGKTVNYKLGVKLELSGLEAIWAEAYLG